MKKFFAILMSVVLMLSLAVPAMAEGETPYTITINNKEGHTYEVYQIFTGDLYEGVLSNIVWGNGVSANGQSTLGDAAAKAEDLNVEADAKSFAKALDGYLTNGQVMTFSIDKHTYTTSTPGYYLIKDRNNSQEANDGTYTAYMLKVVGNVIATPKDSVPTVDKSVTSDGINADDVNIGDTVTFILKAELGSEIDEFEKYKVVFHDTMSANLEFVEYKSATLDGKDVKTSFVKAEDSLTFTCEDVKTLGAKDDSEIVITYTAKLLSAAEIGKPGNSNKVYLEYSNDPTHSGDGTNTGRTPDDEVLVFTYELDVTKVKANTSETLSGAEFVLYRDSDGTIDENTEYAIVANGVLTDWGKATYENEKVSAYPTGSTLTSGSDGLFKIAGLDDGTYYLKEIKAPDGYNLLEEAIKVEIIATLNTTEDTAGLTELEIKIDNGEPETGNIDTGIVYATVENKAGATLPSTGGMGTTIFYAVGGLMVVGAVVLLVTKKRMGAEG